MSLSWPAGIVFDPNPTPERLGDNTTWMQMSVMSVLQFVVLVLVILRIYARAVVTRSFGKDDIALCVAALCSIAGWILFLVQSMHGFGHHIETIPPDDAVIFRKTSYFITMTSSNWGMCALKTAIAFNLLRFCDVQIWSRYRWIIWALLAIIWCYTFIYWVFALTNCNPIRKFWDLDAEGSCISLARYVKQATANTALATSTDVLLALVPIPVVWQIKLSIRVRLYVIAIVSLGYFSVALGIVKIIYQQKYSSTKDKTYYLNIPFWGYLQLQLGIMAASCVALRPLVSRILGLSSYGDSATAPSNAGPHARLPPSIGTASMRRKNKDGPFGDEDFELEEGRPSNVFGANAHQHTTETLAERQDSFGATTSGEDTFYHADSTGSEEAIIQKQDALGVPNLRGPGGGIIRTTEVSVKYNQGPCSGCP